MQDSSRRHFSAAQIDSALTEIVIDLFEGLEMVRNALLELDDAVKMPGYRRYNV